MTNDTRFQAIEEEAPESSPWAHLHIAVIAPTGWTPHHVDAGIRSLDRLRAELDAATALLIATRPDDRDATAALSRLSNITNKEARKRRAVASVVTALPSALDLLRTGALTIDHVAALRAVADKPGAAHLLESGVGMSPEDFNRAVQQFRLALEHGEDTQARQHASRSLRFSNGPNGMIRLTGLLPSLEGGTLETILGAISEAKYRRDNPVRARILGGHDTDSRDQRLADALLELAGITPTTKVKARSTDEADFVEPDHSDTTATTIHHDAPSAPPDHRETTQKPPIRVTTSKPATVIVFNIDRFEAEILNHGPVPVTPTLFDQLKRDLYFCFENNTGEVLKYVRGRREPTLLQKLAVWARDLRCKYPGCDAIASMSHIHHINEWLADQGFTDVEALILLCHAHHQHLHTNQLTATREADGSVSIRLRATGELMATATTRRIAA